MAPFHYYDSDLPASPALVAEIQVGIGNKKNLLLELAERLVFPDYFGVNWDALNDCIRDFSWLPPGPVVLRHRDLPLTGEVSELKKYLWVLNNVAEKKWTVPGQVLRDLHVVFPPETRDRIAALLKEYEEERGI